MRKIVTGHRLAIRHGDALLAVPPMHPDTPQAVRVKVLEYVLRRQMGLAQMAADIAADSMGGADGARARLATMIEEAPYRGSAMAA